MVARVRANCGVGVASGRRQKEKQVSREDAVEMFMGLF